mgnify:CR=1 FL=1
MAAAVARLVLISFNVSGVSTLGSFSISVAKVFAQAATPSKMKRGAFLMKQEQNKMKRVKRIEWVSL